MLSRCYLGGREEKEVRGGRELLGSSLRMVVGGNGSMERGQEIFSIDGVH